jgi:hypothetical protein
MLFSAGILMIFELALNAYASPIVHANFRQKLLGTVDSADKSAWFGPAGISR